MIGLSTKLFILKKQPRNISHSSVPTFIYVLLKEKKTNKKQNKTNKQMQKQTPNIQKTNKQRNNNQKQNITKKYLVMRSQH